MLCSFKFSQIIGKKGSNFSLCSYREALHLQLLFQFNMFKLFDSKLKHFLFIFSYYLFILFYCVFYWIFDFIVNLFVDQKLIIAAISSPDQIQLTITLSHISIDLALHLFRYWTRIFHIPSKCLQDHFLRIAKCLSSDQAFFCDYVLMHFLRFRNRITDISEKFFYLFCTFLNENINRFSMKYNRLILFLLIIV